MERLVGNNAPDFTMATSNGDGVDFGEVKLSDYKGKWLVMFFYPLDFTLVWPTEITGFSERIEDFRKEEAELLAVSVDSVHSHKAWIKGDLGKINYPLASDMTKEVAKDYGVLLEEEGIALRGLFIINPEGVIIYSLIQDNDIGRSVGETLRVLKALRTGGLCPVNWVDGDDLL